MREYLPTQFVDEYLYDEAHYRILSEAISLQAGQGQTATRGRLKQLKGSFVSSSPHPKHSLLPRLIFVALHHESAWHVRDRVRMSRKLRVTSPSSRLGLLNCCSVVLTSEPVSTERHAKKHQQSRLPRMLRRLN